MDISANSIEIDAEDTKHGYFANKDIWSKSTASVLNNTSHCEHFRIW